MLILHDLHESALDVSRVGRLDCGINQTLTTCLCVVEELGRHETIHEGVLDESAGLDTVVVASKVRQSTVLQRILNTLALDILLSKQRNHLRDVLVRTLGT